MTALRRFSACLAPSPRSGFCAGCASVDAWFAHRDPNANSREPRRHSAAGREARRQSEREAVRPAGRLDRYRLPAGRGRRGRATRPGSAGADNASVRYQFDIGETARECDPAGPGQFSAQGRRLGRVADRPRRVAPAPIARRCGSRADETSTATSRPSPRSIKFEATTDGVSAGARSGSSPSRSRCR